MLEFVQHLESGIRVGECDEFGDSMFLDVFRPCLGVKLRLKRIHLLGVWKI